MSHEESAHRSTGAEMSAGVEPFTSAELALMQANDRSAARNIVVLMAGIFIMGVALYAYVGYCVYQG